MNSFHWHLCDDQGWRLQIDKYPKLTENISHYTKEQVRDVLEFAKEHFVNVVPEIEIPGHEKGATKKYPEWSAVNPSNGNLGNVLNIRDATIDAFKDILDEVCELFPSQYIHCGGDEVWGTWVWKVDDESFQKAVSLGFGSTDGNGNRHIQAAKIQD